MLLSGERHEMEEQLCRILAGYTRFADFSPNQLHLIEALRTLRMIHYAAWLARRWDDPAFPKAFPWFGSTRYWESHILSLREQAAALGEPPLSI
jgi:Ser/Thr protein kinase RdoA (MazF antagonist)